MLFVDMDGTLSYFEKEASLEEITTKGYFRGRDPIRNVVSAIRYFAAVNPDKVCILSSVFQDDHSINEKKEWLEEYLPEISLSIFVPYGQSKAEFVEGIFGRSITHRDFLLDDFSKNLHEWTGTGIKLYNDINGTKGTWTGYSVHYNCSPEIIVNTLTGIMSVAAA